MNRNLKGIIMVLGAALAWGLSGVSGQYLMASGVNINLLTSLRLLISGLFLTSFVAISQRQQFLALLKNRTSLLGIVCSLFLV